MQSLLRWFGTGWEGNIPHINPSVTRLPDEELAIIDSIKAMDSYKKCVLSFGKHRPQKIREYYDDILGEYRITRFLRFSSDVTKAKGNETKLLAKGAQNYLKFIERRSSTKGVKVNLINHEIYPLQNNDFNQWFFDRRHPFSPGVIPFAGVTPNGDLLQWTRVASCRPSAFLSERPVPLSQELNIILAVAEWTHLQLDRLTRQIDAQTPSPKPLRNMSFTIKLFDFRGVELKWRELLNMFLRPEWRQLMETVMRTTGGDYCGQDRAILLINVTKDIRPLVDYLVTYLLRRKQRALVTIVGPVTCDTHHKGNVVADCGCETITRARNVLRAMYLTDLIPPAWGGTGIQLNDYVRFEYRLDRKDFESTSASSPASGCTRTSASSPASGCTRTSASSPASGCTRTSASSLSTPKSMEYLPARDVQQEKRYSRAIWMKCYMKRRKKPELQIPNFDADRDDRSRRYSMRLSELEHLAQQWKETSDNTLASLTLTPKSTDLSGTLTREKSNFKYDEKECDDTLPRLLSGKLPLLTSTEESSSIELESQTNAYSFFERRRRMSNDFAGLS